MKATFKNLYADSLLKNSFYLLLTTATMAGFGFVFWLIVSRLYAPEQVGVASSLISSMIFLSYVSLLGFNSTFVRFLPKSEKRSEQINTGLIMVGGASLVLGLLYALIAPAISAKLGVLHQHWYSVPLFALLVMGFAVNLVTDSIFVAFREAKFNFYVDGLFASSLQLIVPFLLVSLGSYGIFAAQGSAAFIAMIASITLLALRFDFRPRFKIDRATISAVYKYSSGSYLANLLNIAPTMILPLTVLNRLGAAAAGYYYFAFMMANLLFTVGYAITQSLFAEGAHDEVALKHLIMKSLKTMVMVMIPASLLLGLLGSYILRIFGSDYATQSVDALRILAVSGMAVALYSLLGVVLRLQGKLRQLIIANAIYCTVIVVMSLEFASRGLVWVALSFLAGNLASAIYMVPAISAGLKNTP